MDYGFVYRDLQYPLMTITGIMYQNYSCRYKRMHINVEQLFQSTIDVNDAKYNTVVWLVMRFKYQAELY